MINDLKPNPAEMLKTANSILLVDWPDKGVPLALLKAGFQVFCYSPDGYTMAEMVANNHKPQLFFRPIDNPPTSIDIVNVYRPEEELPGIIKNHFLPLGAKVLWLHPPLISELAKELALTYGLVLIQGFDIAEIAST
jgi:predicted CoA-binding protein